MGLRKLLFFEVGNNISPRLMLQKVADLRAMDLELPRLDFQ
jgi:hypothetical protein